MTTASTTVDPRLARRRRAIAWFTTPHWIALAAFLGSLAVIRTTDDNRSDIDFFLRVTCVAAAGCALVCTLVALFLHPWRGGAGEDWGRLVAHLLLVSIALFSAFVWMAFHIA